MFGLWWHSKQARPRLSSWSVKSMQIFKYASMRLAVMQVCKCLSSDATVLGGGGRRLLGSDGSKLKAQITLRLE